MKYNILKIFKAYRTFIRFSIPIDFWVQLYPPKSTDIQCRYVPGVGQISVQNFKIWYKYLSNFRGN